MAAEWSGLAAEVLVTLDRSRSVPLRAQLEDQFRRAIRSGRFGSGERVPSSRALATALGLSRGLVQECYAQLLAEGYLVTRGRLGDPSGQGGLSGRAGQPAALAAYLRRVRAADTTAEPPVPGPPGRVRITLPARRSWCSASATQASVPSGPESPSSVTSCKAPADPDCWSCP